MNREHFKKLERMFKAAPINDQLILGAEMKVFENRAELTLPIRREFLHAAMSMHGAIYFKLLDDAAYFAAASAEEEFFLYTKSYEIKFKRPVEGGVLVAKGELVEKGVKEWKAISTIEDEQGKVVASGEGIFVKSRLKLSDQAGYLA